jgi:hypothetical protein
MQGPLSSSSETRALAEGRRPVRRFVHRHVVTLSAAPIVMFCRIVIVFDEPSRRPATWPGRCRPAWGHAGAFPIGHRPLARLRQPRQPNLTTPLLTFKTLRVGLSIRQGGRCDLRERDPGIDVRLVTLPVAEQHDHPLGRPVLREASARALELEGLICRR